jgi:hypothetical protein
MSLAVLLMAVIAVGGCFLFPNNPPVASFTVTRSVDFDDLDSQLVVVLDASGSTDPDGDEIVKYMWVFEEDGVTIIPPIAPLGTTMTVADKVLTVRYVVETTDSKVELVVVDSNGAMSDPLSKEIQVPLPE